MTGQGKSIMPPLQSPRAELFPHNIDICQVVYGLRRMSKPAIAAVNGPCVGSGIGLAAGCDVRIASEKARFGWVFVRRGLLPDDGSLPLVPQIIGYAKAFEWGATGRILSAQEALDIGFVREVVPHDQLLPKSVELAREMIENCPPISLELFKLALVESLTMAPEHAILMGDKAQTHHPGHRGPHGGPAGLCREAQARLEAEVEHKTRGLSPRFCALSRELLFRPAGFERRREVARRHPELLELPLPVDSHVVVLVATGVPYGPVPVPQRRRHEQVPVAWASSPLTVMMGFRT